MEQQAMEEILTPSEVATLFKVHVNTVYKLAKEGRIPGYRVGRGWRFSRTDIVKFLSRRQRAGLKAKEGGFNRDKRKLLAGLQS